MCMLYRDFSISKQLLLKGHVSIRPIGSPRGCTAVAFSILTGTQQREMQMSDNGALGCSTESDLCDYVQICLLQHTLTLHRVCCAGDTANQSGTVNSRHEAFSKVRDFININMQPAEFIVGYRARGLFPFLFITNKY